MEDIDFWKIQHVGIKVNGSGDSKLILRKGFQTKIVVRNQLEGFYANTQQTKKTCLL